MCGCVVGECLMCLNRTIRSSRKRIFAKLKELIETEDSLFHTHPDVLARENAKLVPVYERLSADLRERYHKKLNWVLKFQVPKTNQRPTFPFILWDNIQPPNFVIDILRYGPTFAPPPPKNGTRDLIPDMEYLLKSLPDTQKEYYRWMSSINIRKAKEQQEIIELRDKVRRTARWMRRNGVILTRADKSRMLVLMKRSSYQQGLREYIDNTMCEKEKDDVIDKLQAKVRHLADSRLTKCLALHDVIVDSPDVPRLFAYAKTHKMGQQLCPIVDKVRAPTRKLEKAIHNLLTPHLENYPYNVNKPTDLIRLLQDLPSPPRFMIVLDFKSMYCTPQ
ncbi:uncharacterized protein LOC111625074 [Centruroides sculpturatus]|uniref:uncharacterized protein LOC111625074 n=1 Tax=Centruroides sculpturatus TaxID=218467 RepID=UPI000C6E13E3|nr:uncharacterized protein LOC111625074 [Centruroides sculpturatus]